MTRPPVGLADLVKAASALEVEGRALDSLLDLCGFELPDELPIDPPEPPPPEPPLEPPEPEASPTVPTLVAAEERSEDVVWLTPSALGSDESIPVDPLDEEPEDELSRSLPHHPLLSRRSEVGLTLVAIAVSTPTGVVDELAVVRELSRLRPMTELPMIHAPSLAAGVQVLVDVGESMQPFLRDQVEFCNRLKGRMGRSVQILYYSDDPDTGVGPSLRRHRWAPYDLPDEQQPILLLSDLGCGTPQRLAATQAIERLARRLRRRNSRLVAFAPIQRDRLAPSLRALVELVVWDRSTGRRDVAALGAGLT